MPAVCIKARTRLTASGVLAISARISGVRIRRMARAVNAEILSVVPG